MAEIFIRETVYIWYYFNVQLEQLLPYWILGMVTGSLISVFLKSRLHSLVSSNSADKSSALGIALASLLGIVSPLCMYGTIPVAASLAKGGVKEEWLAAFMTASVLLNPQLIIYSMALGNTALAVRLVSCLLCAIIAGFLVRIFYKDKLFFNFRGFAEPANRDIEASITLRFFKNLGRNIRVTGVYFLVGILLSALFQRYVPADLISSLFGTNRAFGVLLAATIGVPLYACGGGTIPLLQNWLWNGMSTGSAAAFMISGPATKITNLGALKIVLGGRGFILYIVYIMMFALVTGLIVNVIL